MCQIDPYHLTFYSILFLKGRLNLPIDGPDTITKVAKMVLNCKAESMGDVINAYGAFAEYYESDNQPEDLSAVQTCIFNNLVARFIPKP
jgi:hypothetical protein